MTILSMHMDLPGGGGWQRLWESEQNDYSPKKYNPQHIMAVHVSRLLLGGPPLS